MLVKLKILFVYLGILICFNFGCKKSINGQEFTNLTGDYLGQEPPGTEPMLFAPGIFNKEVHSAAIFSPDGNEVYWNWMSSNQIFFMRKENNKWSTPREVPFALAGGTGDPAFSHDGNKLFFTSFQPAGEGGTANKENIWFVEREGSGWSDPEPLSQVVNQYYLHWQFSLSVNGNLYFSAKRNGSEGDSEIYRADYSNGEYTTIERLGDSINSPIGDSCTFIAPDESYLIFSRYGGTIGYADLLISFKKPDGTWSQAKNMGRSINTNGNDTCPFVTSDGKYLFYIRNVGEELRIYWINSDIIEQLKPDELK